MGGWHSRSRRTSYDRRFYELLLPPENEYRRRVFCLKQGRAAPRISFMFPASIQFDGLIEGADEKDLYRLVG